jgi:hypothetical protein
MFCFLGAHGGGFAVLFGVTKDSPWERYYIVPKIQNVQGAETDAQ